MRYAIAMALGVCLAGAEARAATIAVTTRHDVVADDGLCSLREAVTAANTQRRSGASPGECPAGSPPPAVDVIQIPRGSYKLTLGDPDEDGNAGGDLDVTESVVLAGAGRTATLVKNAIGAPDVEGDGDRLVHVDPAGRGGVDVTFRDLTLMKGDVGCSGADCTTGASGVEAPGDGALVFERCRLLRNVATCTGELCGDSGNGGAIRAVGGGALTIRDSILRHNRSECHEPGCRVGAAAIQMFRPGGAGVADFLLQGSTIGLNGAACFDDRCSARAVVEVEAGLVLARGNKIMKNGSGCLGAECRGSGVLVLEASVEAELENLQLHRNGASCGGDACLAPPIAFVQSAGSVALTGAKVLHNQSVCLGDGCKVREQVDVASLVDRVYVEGLELRDAIVSCETASCGTADVLQVRAIREVVLADSLVSNARNECFGTSCDVEDVVSIRGERFDLVRSTVESSVVGCDGDGCTSEHVLDVEVADAVAVTDGVIASNAGGCEGEECVGLGVVEIVADGAVSLNDSAVTSNTAACDGEDCEVENVARLEGRSLALGAVVVSDNASRCESAECRANPILDLNAESTISATSWSVERNVVACEGAGCVADAAVHVRSQSGDVSDALLAANRSECAGTGCNVGFGGALRNLGGVLRIRESTFEDNRTDGFGAAAFNGAGAELVLTAVTMRSNQAGLRRTIEFGGAGGAVYNDVDGGKRGVLRINSSAIHSNRAAMSGGGILNEGTVVVASSSITANQPTNCVNFIGGTGCP